VAGLVLQRNRASGVEEGDRIVEAADFHRPETTIPRP
jgi:hypothetical protein